MAEPGVLRRDHQVDQLGQIQPGAHADSLHLGDDRLQGVVEGHVVGTEPPVPQETGSLAGTPRLLAVGSGLEPVGGDGVVIVVPGTE